MLALERQQMQEERALLVHPPTNGQHDHVALSAPTTPPRTSASIADPPPHSAGGGVSLLHLQALTNGLNDYSKRHSANYGAVAPSSILTQTSNPTDGSLMPGSHNYATGAKSMPGSRRGSSGSSDGGRDMTSSLNLGLLSIHDNPVLARTNGVSPLRSATNPEALKVNAASLFDEDLDNEMSSEPLFCIPKCSPYCFRLLDWNAHFHFLSLIRVPSTPADSDRRRTDQRPR